MTLILTIVLLYDYMFLVALEKDQRVFVRNVVFLE